MFNQAIDTANVRRETLDGTEYVVAPINLLQPMYLNVPSNWDATEAYLPAQQAKESLPSWNGTPLTLNHPTSNGVATTANQPEMVEKTVLGRVYNAEWEDNKATAEAWFNEQKIRDMGGTAENALEEVVEGNTVEVSTGYRASKLPSGEYDGETHNAVQGNLKPDHVAVLPNNQGKCSVEAGCGVGAVAANMVVTNMVENQVEYSVSDVFDADQYSESDYTDDEWDGSAVVSALPNPTEDDEAPGVLDDTHALEPQGEDARENKGNWKAPFRASPEGPVNTRALVAIKAAAQGARGGFEGVSSDLRDTLVSRVNEMLEEAPDELFGAAEEVENTIEQVVNRLASLWNSESAEPAESGRTADTEHTSMPDKTTELVDNHGFEAQNLPDEETDCFDAIYNRFVGEEPDDPEDDDVTNSEKVVFDSQEEFEAAVNDIVEDREAQSEKQQLASEIASNSTEYEDTEAVLEDYPTEAALNTKHKDLTGGANFGATRGASASPATNEENAEDLKMFGGDA